MDDDHRERTRDTERTTIVHTGGGGGGGGTLVAVILGVLLIGLILLAVFGGLLGDATEDMGVPSDMDVNVNIGSPDVDMPQIDAPEVDAPAEPAENSN